MIFTRRKTIGVFISKMFSVFDDAVFRALAREGKRLDYDIVVFATAGYFLPKSDYDVQEKNIFRFAAVDKLDGIIIVPDSYEAGEFRNLLYDMLRHLAIAINNVHMVLDCDVVLGGLFSEYLPAYFAVPVLSQFASYSPMLWYILKGAASHDVVTSF